MQANHTVGRQLSCVPLGESHEAPPGEVSRAPLSAIDAIAGKSAAVQHVLNQAQLVAATDSTVLLLGETGTGKELFAAYIHQLSARRAREMVCVNCAAIPATLIESELFGREQGAYTDANSQQIGRFELAHRSTIFLDEIGDLPFEVQVKLLRVLEERQIERLGSVKSINVDTRIIAATHRSLEQRIAEGAFRADLFYRLNVFPLRVPPLRERAEDIPLLVWRFIEEFSATFGKRIEEVPARTWRRCSDTAGRGTSGNCGTPWRKNSRAMRQLESSNLLRVRVGIGAPLPPGTSALSIGRRRNPRAVHAHHLARAPRAQLVRRMSARNRSLPVPVSPSSNTVESVAAASCAWCRTC